MKHWFTLFWCCLLSFGAAAQQESRNWYFGNNAGLTFTNGVPAAVSGARVGYESTAAVSDAAGRLLFYTNSVDVWDRNHQPMLNGQNIGGHESAAQGAVIVRHPGNASQYFIFVTDGCDNYLTGGLKYALVDMTRQKRAGAVVSRGNQLLGLPVAEKVTAVRHHNGRDTWIIVHGWETNAFYAYLLSPTGIAETPVISTVGSVHKGGSGAFHNANAVGYMKASADGSRLALAKRDSNFELFDFDNATGQLANPITLPQFYRSYGVEFSADGAYLYGSTLNGNCIYQFDLRAATPAALVASATLVGSSAGYGFAGALQRGPDDRIYVALYNSHYIGVIGRPSEPGTACAYQNEGVPLGEMVSQLGLPNFPNAFALNEWTGAASTAYADPGNWLNEVVPGAQDDVVIRAEAGRMPVLESAAAARNFTVEPGASMTNNGTLTLRGNLRNEGRFAGDGTLVSAGEGLHRFGGNLLTLGSLTVEHPAEVQLTGPVRLRQVLTLDGNLRTNDHALTLVADAAGSALVVNQRGAVTGSVTVQRYLPAAAGTGAAVYHLATPVQHPPLASLASTATAPSIFTYNGSTATDFSSGWQVSAPAATLVGGQGYSVSLPAQTVSFVGELNNGSYAATGLSRSAGPQAGWWLLGNPYPAPILWDKTLAGAVGLDDAVYVFNPAGPFPGSYSSYVRGVGVNGGRNSLALGQSFFVRTSRPGTSGSLTFANGARQTTYDAPAAPPDARTRLQLELQGGAGTDEVAVYFEEQASAGFDSGFDAYKLAGTNPLLISVPVGAEQLAIQGLASLQSQDVPVPLLVRLPQAGRYTLRARQLLNLPAGSVAYLLDAETGLKVDLRQQPAYTFAAATAGASRRFSLLFTGRQTLAVSGPDQDFSLFPNPAEGEAWLQLPPGLARKGVVVTLYNTLGQAVREYKLSPTASDVVSLSLIGLIEGIYVVQVLTALGKMNRRLRVR
ncbi:T9SS type A sorting domain-containing protein [Hymenobacter persicinus]|uniref:T9SS type A sorting domain-containing protein n=1 Tax=Hymenobacter persicinus TaxID=2025506 RepID=A0A4Q5LFT4_9BACT|nr:T9SS type A sorting domain-containing protein [Hymenobacter persicinus]RYU82395.1 T9SS type A sorting domain-containing protein [Hymenobacter persicinus]